MQALANRPRRFHKRRNRDGRILHNHMRRRNRLVLVQSPDMQLMHRGHPGHRLEVVLDVAQVDAARRALQQDLAAVPDQREG